MPTVERHEQVTAVDGHEPTAVLRIPRSRIRRFPGQPRQYLDARDMADLAASIEEIGQHTPIVVREIFGDPKHDYELVDGERRLIACGMAGVETMLAWVRPFKDSPDIDDEQFVASVVGNFGRTGHTPLEIARAIDRIRKSKRMWELSAGEQIARIAKIFAHSEVWIYQHLAILRLHPDVQAMMEPTVPEEQRLGHSLAVFISSLHHDLQKQIATEAMERRMNINQARTYARQAAGDAGLTVGVAKRKRHPAYEFHNLAAFVKRTQESIASFRTPAIQDLLKRYDPRGLALMATEIEQTMTQLDQLRAELISTP
ncbi:MAG: ParB/RepB/Spo0J family partition protein [bacterium]|nr:ParB/RepB/Spo0J family partition protein [bacterium]